MKVTRIQVYLARSGKLNPIMVQVTTESGLTGIGEAGVAYGKGATATAGMIRDLAPLLLRRDAGRIEQFLSDVYDHTFWAKNGGTIVYAAVSALEQALWDIKGKALGVPVWQLLGGAVQDRLRCYANGWYEAAQTPDEFARAVERPLKDGYTALKFYPLGQMVGVNMRHVSRRMLEREQLDLAVERVRAVRKAAGPSVELMLDLSGGITAAEATRLCQRFEEFDIFFVEEPSDPADAQALAGIAQRTSIPLAAGERHYTRAGMRPLIEARAVDILQPDPTNTGGILETKKIAAMGEAWGMRVAPHVCGSPVATNVALQVAATLPNFIIQELYPYFRFHDGWLNFVHEPAEARVCDGYLTLPEGPGLGIDLDESQLTPFLWATCD